MDEMILMTLISEGETTSRVEFKRELHLDRADEKAEFIKDVISLSNSAPQNKGYLLVGIDNNKYIVGTHQLEEERIQQLVHSHIRPSIKLRCIMVSTTAPNLPSVGIIEIEGTERPHRVSIPIDKLKQDDIFVRHGSVVERATPDEIRSMEEEKQVLRDVTRYMHAAETHLDLGNFQEAIDIYTQAIKSMPLAELFLGRGRVYSCYADEKALSESEKRKFVLLALKDFSAAIRLTKSADLEKNCRLERLRIKNLMSLQYTDNDEWDQDNTWLKDKVKDRKYREVLYLEYDCYEGNVGYSHDEPNEVMTAMNKVIESGYTEPKVYELRAKANFTLCNYGLALQDVDTALANVTKAPDRIDFYTLRANIQVKMAKFAEAYSSFSAARTLYRVMSNSRYRDWIDETLIGIEDELLWRFGLEAEFGQLDEPSFASAILATVINDLARIKGKSFVEIHGAMVIPTIKRFIVGDG